MIIIIILLILMKYICIKNLVDPNRLIIETIRIWIRSMVYDQNPFPTLKIRLITMESKKLLYLSMI